MGFLTDFRHPTNTSVARHFEVHVWAYGFIVPQTKPAWVWVKTLSLEERIGELGAWYRFCHVTNEPQAEFDVRKLTEGLEREDMNRHFNVFFLFYVDESDLDEQVSREIITRDYYRNIWGAVLMHPSAVSTDVVKGTSRPLHVQIIGLQTETWKAISQRTCGNELPVETVRLSDPEKHHG